MAILVAITFTQITIAQEVRVNNATSNLTIFGTSNIHDWDMKAEKLSGVATFKMEDGKLSGVEKLNFSVEVESLKSGKSGMDKNTYNALDSKSHKTITYTLTKVNKVTETANNTFSIETTGNLKIAGETKLIPIKFIAKTNDNKVALSGKVDLNMTHYKIEPPKALMGTIKTGEDVTIDFEVIYN
ncbi:MAG: YceI family protein [Flavobacteriaceae bacterium]|nr:YceI family protein [Flavobacteriaceae bacterium]